AGFVGGAHTIGPRVKTLGSFGYRAGTSAPGRSRPPSHLLGEVRHLAESLDQPELGLERVDVALLRHEHLLEQLAATVVAEIATQRDAPVEARDRVVRQLQIELELLAGRLANVDLVVALKVGE